MDTKNLVLDGKTVGMDEHGRYSANDVHRLSGGAEKHEPHRYLKLEKTKTLIQLIDSTTDRSVGRKDCVSVFRSGLQWPCLARKDDCYFGRRKRLSR